MILVRTAYISTLCTECTLHSNQADRGSLPAAKAFMRHADCREPIIALSDAVHASPATWWVRPAPSIPQYFQPCRFEPRNAQQLGKIATHRKVMKQQDLLAHQFFNMTR